MLLVVELFIDELKKMSFLFFCNPYYSPFPQTKISPTKTPFGNYNSMSLFLGFYLMTVVGISYNLSVRNFSNEI